MSDPVLDAHRSGLLAYTISRPQPISMRDQVLRGATIVQRLSERGEIGADRPLVVVGAGAGGATAAVEAALNQKIWTVLVDSANAPFLMQRLATTRIVNPTQYDWPVNHFHFGRVPWGLQPTLPFSLSTGPADQLSIGWQAKLTRLSRVLHPRLDVRYGTSVARTVRLRGPSPRLGIDFSPSGRIVAGAIIYAKGFGNEQCSVFDSAGSLLYEGQPFWGPDKFGTLDPAQHRVLISGSGDGALQDYLRIVTGLGHTMEIANRCNIRPSILREIQSAEDRCLRGWSWACDDQPFRQRQEAPFLEELEDTHRAVADRILRSPLVISGLSSLIPDPPVPVTIVYREKYITAYYGLNRFLTSLISSYEKQTFNHNTLYPDHQIKLISPSRNAPHTCTMAIGGQMRASGTYINGILVSHNCFEKEHDVVFNPPISGLPSAYNVIIVRHGLSRKSYSPLIRTRHLLPYHRP